jgi:oligoendopeptidase F
VDDPGARLSVLGRRVEDQLVAVFREAALHRFEREVHDRAAGDVLDAEELGERWLAGQRDLYGPAVALSPGYRHWWSYLDSLFLAPGTAWPYVYGQLAALALVEAHRDDPRRFGDRFVAVLAEGAGRPPAALLGSLGVDVGSPDGWRRGLDVLGEEVSALVALATAGAGVPRPRDGGPVAGGGDKGNDDGRR